MKVVDIISKDFTELFPTLIGDEEPKLSIDDLMETSHDYIMKELHNLKEGVNPDENAELISFLKLMEVAELDIEYDSHVHFLLKRIAEKYPDHKSFRFCEFRYVLNTIINNTDNTQEFLTNFYDKVFSDHTLMNLTDYIQKSGLGNSLILLNEVNDEIINILEDAVTNYPQKIILLWITANLYRVQGKYQEAIKHNQQFLEKNQKILQEEIDLDFVDGDAEQMVCFQLADLHFNIRDYYTALHYCNRLLNQEKGKIYSENIKFYYFDSLIIRIRIHMVSDNKSEFNKDYDELLKAIKEEELTGNYSDIIDYSKQLKL